MRRKEFYWSLYHTPEKRQLNNLRTGQVEAVFTALPKVHHGDWLIWREGFKVWKPLAEFPVLLQSLRNLKSVSENSPPPVPVGDIEEIEKEIERKVASELLSLSLDDRRAQKKKFTNRPNRIAFSFQIQIQGSQGQIFQTGTQNISLNGLQLSEPLPNWVPKYFTLEVHNDDQVISLLCSGIQDEGENEIYRLRIEANDSYNILRSWIVAVV